MRIPGIRYVQGRNDYTDADGTKYGIAIHNTSNTATAAGEASYAARRTDGTSSHFYVDGTEVIQSLDTDDRAGHAASSNGNQNALAVEITGTNDKARAWWLANVAWDELGRVLAACCKKYGIAVRRASVAEMKANPKVKAFYSHNDMRLAWGGTTHTDPGPGFPWDRLFDAVSAALDPTTEDDDMTPAQDQLLTATAWRLDALREGLDKVKGGPTAGETVWIVGAVKALANAVGQVDDQVAAKVKSDFDALDAAVAASRVEIAGVDEQVVERLGAADLTAAQKAALLRPVLGDDAAAVGALLAS